MQALLAGGSLSLGLERVAEYAQRIGTYAVRFIERNGRVLADPERGGILAIAVIKAAPMLKVNAQWLSAQLESVASQLDSLMPDAIIGPQPGNPLDDAVKTANSLLPPEQCNPIDLACQIREAVKAVARGILTGFLAFVYTVHWVMYWVAYYAILALSRLGAAVIRYLVKPLVSAIAGAWNFVVDGITKLMCVYVNYVAIPLEIVRGAKRIWNARNFISGVLSAAMPALVYSVVLGDCAQVGVSIVPSPPAPAPVVTPPAPPPITVQPVMKYFYVYDTVGIRDGLYGRITTVVFRDAVSITEGAVVE